MGKNEKFDEYIISGTIIVIFLVAGIIFLNGALNLPDGMDKLFQFGIAFIFIFVPCLIVIWIIRGMPEIIPKNS